MVVVLTVVLGRFKEEVERVGRRILEGGLVKILPRNPNVLTISSLLITIPTPLIVLLRTYWAYITVLILIILAGAFDLLDGLIARYWGRTSRLGAFLDSTLDRYVDSIALIDLWLMYNGGFLGMVFLILALLGSLMTSYVRARAESLGVKMLGVGLLEREERLLFMVALFIIYIVTGSGYVIFYGLLLLAVLTNATAIERLLYVARSLSRDS